jgi:hypothetical protein
VKYGVALVKSPAKPGPPISRPGLPLLEIFMIQLSARKRRSTILPASRRIVSTCGLECRETPSCVSDVDFLSTTLSDAKHDIRSIHLSPALEHKAQQLQRSKMSAKMIKEARKSRGLPKRQRSHAARLGNDQHKFHLLQSSEMSGRPV